MVSHTRKPQLCEQTLCLSPIITWQPTFVRLQLRSVESAKKERQNKYQTYKISIGVDILDDTFKVMPQNDSSPMSE